MQKHPKLLRRPLPPKLPKLPLYKMKVHTAKTIETKPPGIESTEDETTSFQRDETAFPDVVSRNQSHAPISVQTLSLDRPIQEKATVLIPKQPFQRVYIPLPDTAIYSLFIPTCCLTSTQVFGKDTSQMESSRSSKQVPYKIKKIYVDSRVKDALILSSAFTKTSRIPSSVTTFKPQEVHSEYPPLPKILGSALIRQPSPVGFHAATPSPLPSILSIKQERPFNRTQQNTAATLTINDFPAKISLPSPVLPRKPQRQSLLEMLVAEPENVENIRQPSLPAKPKDSIKTKRNESLAEGIYGDSYKTIEVTQYEAIMAITKMAIINCQIYGRNALNLKGFFLLNCPDLTPLAYQLMYLNLSFNDIRYFPTEVFCLKNLQILILRNNPIKEIPSEIQQLKYLRVFSIAFNLITSLPPGLFSLAYLEELDISYNDIASIPNEIQKLRSLEKLILDGNDIVALPSGILRLNLKKIQLENTFTHPNFWKENSLNTPWRLVEIISFYIVKNNLRMYYHAIPRDVQKILQRASKCEWCFGPMFAGGFRIIQSCDIFGVTQLPVMFHVCSSTCYRKLKENNLALNATTSKK
ncbi:leucine-rich repeat-containing protein 63 [Choloepus didactylus]|uniref:leucine-rich repeat-containing protein 63 n=1 Tax=Choloepus didactylus TaxID=27675 RepID=UPI00189CE918|nr:leucine-rich repeat-containing protein 63 [Choloepus didactylus]